MQTFYFEPTAQVRRLLETIKHHLPMIETEHELSEIYYFIRELYHNSGNCLVWMENSPDVRICISKKDIHRGIAELLYQTGRSTILTSATISSKPDGTPQERCSYFLDSIGYPEIGMVSEPKQSPYDYDRNTMLYCSASMPFPKHDRREEYLKASILEIVKLLHITNGKALILFTAKMDMEYVYKRLSNMHLPFRILMQGRTSSQEYQLNKFRNDVNSILLGTGTYWEGINVEGESLSHVIIYMLPFPVPDPIIDYKMSLTEHPIDDVAVPEMITKLRQGAGRLIRSANDKGIVSILDPRVMWIDMQNTKRWVKPKKGGKRRTSTEKPWYYVIFQPNKNEFLCKTILLNNLICQSKITPIVENSTGWGDFHFRIEKRLKAVLTAF